MSAGDQLLEEILEAQRELGRLEGFEAGRQEVIGFLAREVIAGRMVVVDAMRNYLTKPEGFPSVSDLRHVDVDRVGRALRGRVSVPGFVEAAKAAAKDEAATSLAEALDPPLERGYERAWDGGGWLPTVRRGDSRKQG